LTLNLQADLPPLMEVTPTPFNPKVGLLRIDEFKSILSKEEEETNRSAGNPQFKKRKQSGSKNDSAEDVFLRQLKAAKNISATCRWILDQVEMQRISNTRNDWFEKSHFTTNNCVAQREINWLEAHSTVEQVLSEYVDAYEQAPKWEPFPRAVLSPEDLEKMANEKAKCLKDMEETKKLQSFLVRFGDNASADQHLVGYGNNAPNVQWIADTLKRKPTKKKEAPTNTTVDATNGSMDISRRKCNVIECDYDTIEGTCSNSSCSMFKFCDIHLEHTSHMNHQVGLEDRRENAVSVFFLF
jgi:hypothetical protein